eukprot:COSAG06_NODE_5030_length_3777_cov_4.431485_8_plen_60_part_00
MIILSRQAQDGTYIGLGKTLVPKASVFVSLQYNDKINLRENLKERYGTSTEYYASIVNP